MNTKPPQLEDLVQGLVLPPQDEIYEVIERPTLTASQLAVIAREVATNLKEIDLILTNFQLTRGQFDTYVITHPYYQVLLKTYTREWEAIGSTNKRLTFQAAAALEEQLPVLASRMGSNREDLSDAVNAAKLFAQLAGASTDVGSNLSQEKFHIEINIGNRTIAVEAKPVVPEQSQSAGNTKTFRTPTPLQLIAERPTNDAPPQPIPERIEQLAQIQPVPKGTGPNS